MAGYVLLLLLLVLKVLFHVGDITGHIVVVRRAGCRRTSPAVISVCTEAVGKVVVRDRSHVILSNNASVVADFIEQIWQRRDLRVALKITRVLMQPVHAILMGW